MAFRPKGPCSYPGCNTITLDGRCAKHKPRDDVRPNSHDRGYDHNWTRLRNWYIRIHPVCEIQEKCSGDAAIEVDHILSIRNGGERLDQDNLQSTCKRCHAWKTAVVDRADAARHTE